MKLSALLILLFTFALLAQGLEVVLDPYSDLYEQDYQEIRSFSYPSAQETEETCDCYGW